MRSNSIRLAAALLLALLDSGMAAAQKMFVLEKDSIPLFRGVTVMADVVGPAQLLLSDYGQWEAAVRVNLHDQWFPIVELGYGKASHTDDDLTGISYRTKAPFFRLGCDFNILRQKHSPYLLYIGARYAFTAYNFSIDRQPFPDPVWQWDTSYGVADEAGRMHWLELVFGLDARVAGPLRMGWSARFRRRLHHNDISTGNTWYVPGFGIYGTTRLAATFNIGLEF